jgi:hypothetical protein
MTLLAFRRSCSPAAAAQQQQQALFFLHGNPQAFWVAFRWEPGPRHAHRRAHRPSTKEIIQSRVDEKGWVFLGRASWGAWRLQAGGCSSQGTGASMCCDNSWHGVIGAMSHGLPARPRGFVPSPQGPRNFVGGGGALGGGGGRGRGRREGGGRSGPKAEGGRPCAPAPRTTHHAPRSAQTETRTLVYHVILWVPGPRWRWALETA